MLFRIDATDSTRVARFINDGTGVVKNAYMRPISHKGLTRLCLFASKRITPGIEIHYDYGDKSQNLWWRVNTLLFHVDYVSCVYDLVIDSSLVVLDIIVLVVEICIDVCIYV
jgi:hypothetical protein